MNKFLRPVPLALVSLLLFSGLGFIYWKSEAYNINTQTKIAENLRQLEALDAEWNLDVWRSKDGVTRDLDKLSSPQEKLLKLQNEINDEFAGLNNPTLDKADADLKQLIAKKLSLVEAFKSQNAVLTNSLKFIPTANAELQQLIAEERFKKPARATMLAALSELTDNLLTETLKYNLAPNAETKTNIELGISFIESVQSTHTEAIAEQIDVLLNHASTVLRQKERADASLKDINALSVSQHTKQIDNVLNSAFMSQMQQEQSYRNYLFVYAGVLLMLLGFVGYKLLQTLQIAHQTNNELHIANNTLDDMVAVRTEMVTLAMDELKESQVQLVQSEKMASIGQMVAGVTHEINTPLAYVKSGLEISRSRISDVAELLNEAALLHSMLQSGQADDEVLAHQLQRVGEVSHSLSEADMINELDGLLKDGLHGIDQISEIVVGLKNFSRLDREKIAAFNIHEGLDNTIKIAKNVVKYKLITKQYGENISPITCSPSAINQVFLNLISNAAQATGDDGEIKIVTSQRDQHVRIDIIDNGTGIPEDKINKIFEPFFTTKKIGEGTGLGLSIVQRIVREHGGEITVHSKVGLGTKFTLLFPVEMSTQQPFNEPAFA